MSSSSSDKNESEQNKRNKVLWKRKKGWSQGEAEAPSCKWSTQEMVAHRGKVLLLSVDGSAAGSSRHRGIKQGKGKEKHCVLNRITLH